MSTNDQLDILGWRPALTAPLRAMPTSGQATPEKVCGICRLLNKVLDSNLANELPINAA